METTAEIIHKRIRYLENNKPDGSTNINDALIKGIQLIKSDGNKNN